MEYRKLGPSRIDVSLVGLGTNNFGGRLDLEASRNVIHAALDAGVTHFDTSDTYGRGGGSERIIGEVLGGRRSEVFLATKFGKPMSDNPSGHRGSRAYVVSAVDASLKRLRTDRIDLLTMHEPDVSTPIEETLTVLDELRRAGKIGLIAASNFSAAQLSEALAAAARLKVPGFVATQDEYSLTSRGIEPSLLPTLAEHRLSLVPFFPLGGGALSGKYRKGAPMPVGTRHQNPDSPFLGPHWDTIEGLRAFAERHGHTLLELAMSWLAASPLVASIIAGATKPEQVIANARAVTWRLSPAELEEIDRITAPPVAV
jgi:aryl-alcohol dehydrogenase-like predicted oxidoreductase